MEPEILNTHHVAKLFSVPPWNGRKAARVLWECVGLHTSVVLTHLGRHILKTLSLNTPELGGLTLVIRWRKGTRREHETYFNGSEPDFLSLCYFDLTLDVSLNSCTIITSKYFVYSDYLLWLIERQVMILLSFHGRWLPKDTPPLTP